VTAEMPGRLSLVGGSSSALSRRASFRGQVTCSEALPRLAVEVHPVCSGAPCSRSAGNDEGTASGELREAIGPDITAAQASLYRLALRIGLRATGGGVGMSSRSEVRTHTNLPRLVLLGALTAASVRRHPRQVYR